jgi:hypothetical protein
MEADTCLAGVAEVDPKGAVRGLGRSARVCELEKVFARILCGADTY